MIYLEESDSFIVNGKKVETQLVQKKSRKRKWRLRESPSEVSSLVLDNDTFPIGWSEPGHNLIYYRPNEIIHGQKVVIFDVDGTIIKTKSGKTFPIDKDDWLLWHSNVKTKLNQLIDDGVRVIFLTNQNGIDTGKTNKTDFKLKIESILAKLEVDIEVFVAAGSSIFRKPLPGTFYLLKEYLGMKSENILMVGDAAGRIAKKPHRPKKDFSASDRTYAINAGISFRTPEQYFLGQLEEEEYELSERVQDKLEVQAKTEKLKKRKKEIKSILQTEPCVMFIALGYPGSGKSTFGKELAKEFNFEICCRDDIGSTDKCLKVAQNKLQEGKSVYIDATNGDSLSRKPYLSLAQKISVPAYILYHSDVDIELARHLCRFRQYTCSTGKTIKDVVLYTYRKKFEEPQRTEGFEKIIKIPFVPKFENEMDENIFNWYLPS